MNRISASIMCAPPLNMQSALDALAEEKIDYFHCDVMDGHFVPNLTLSPDVIRAVRARYPAVPLDIHLMAENPEWLFPLLPLRAGDICSIHYESVRHVQRALSLIKQTGATAALALNPATPLTCAGEVLQDIGMLLIMTVNPGFAGQKLVPQTLDKIARARKMLDENGFKDVFIEADGNCSFENIRLMRLAGASLFVAGTSSVFHKDATLAENLRKARGM